MPTKHTISILALFMLMALPAGIATAEIQVQNGDTSVKIDDNGDIRIKRDRRKFFRPRVYRGSAISVPTRTIYPQNTTKNSNCITHRSTRKSGYGNNRSYTQTRTTTCQ